MPYTNSIGATPNSLASIGIYLGNQMHPHHKDHEIPPTQFIGVKNAQEFLSVALRSFEAKLKRKTRGPKPKNAADWIIVRTPEEANLTSQEMRIYETEVQEQVGLGGEIVGLLNWHKNTYTGAFDLNLLMAAWTTHGNAVRDRQIHPIKNLRWRMDQVTDELNILRRMRGISLIQTMREVKRAQSRERGEQDVVELLARLPKPPTKVVELEAAVLAIGAQVTRYNAEKDKISVKLEGRKKAKKFRVSTLMEAVQEKTLEIKKEKKGREIEPLNDTPPH